MYPAVCNVYCPKGQNGHDVALVVLLYCPLGHESQIELPGFAAYVPGRQGLQVTYPLLEICPAGHGIQLHPYESVYWPALQLEVKEHCGIFPVCISQPEKDWPAGQNVRGKPHPQTE